MGAPVSGSSATTEGTVMPPENNIWSHQEVKEAQLAQLSSQTILYGGHPGLPLEARLFNQQILYGLYPGAREVETLDERLSNQ